ncbi:alginate export family protein [Qipengyuania sp. CAU 1752]
MHPGRSIILFASFAALLSGTAQAQDGDSIADLSLKPVADVRLRYEGVDQPATDADAITARIRTGVDVRTGNLSFLVEGEANLAISESYNAFPFPTADSQRRPQYSVVADPENFELNRLQVSYMRDGSGVTLGRQRINLDDQRWVGSVGWRQNEQTFDAVRGQANLGVVAVDLTYSNSQRTIFGADAGPRTALDGSFVLAGAGVGLGPVKAKAFAYLVDYDDAFLLANSSQTYGLLMSGGFALGEAVQVSLKASFARQFDYAHNPNTYGADYWLLEAKANVSDFAITAGWEVLGSDSGVALQTPLATLHKFNGFADAFLNTPNDGLRDQYIALQYSFGRTPALRGLNFNLTYHQFGSDLGAREYGHEWNAAAGLKLGDMGLLAKFARYEAEDFGVDTTKLWLEANWSY